MVHYIMYVGDIIGTIPVVTTLLCWIVWTLVTLEK